MTLRERCAAFTAEQGRTHDGAVEDLVAFVVAEIGRTADSRLDSSLPLCLYFPTAEDREEFIEAVQLAKPNMVAKRLP